jgi:ribosomal protein S18 acetylase RimI-like enzyme
VTVTLRPLRDEEFEAWRDHHVGWYAADLVDNAGMPAAAAERKAHSDIDRALPDGLATPGNVVLAVEENMAVVGSVWFAPREQHGIQHAFLYAIEILDEHRGRGLGRRAMELLEGELRERGLPRMELNVFAGNARARSLYRSLGFAETAVHMGKDIG